MLAVFLILIHQYRRNATVSQYSFKTPSFSSSFNKSDQDSSLFGKSSSLSYPTIFRKTSVHVQDMISAFSLISGQISFKYQGYQEDLCYIPIEDTNWMVSLSLVCKVRELSISSILIWIKHTFMRDPWNTISSGIVGGIIIAAILLITTIWVSNSARIGTNQAVNRVSKFYLEELAGRRAQVVSEELSSILIWIKHTFMRDPWNTISSTGTARITCFFAP